MRPDGISLLLLAALGGLVLVELPATGTTAALLRLLFLAATAGIIVLEGGRGSRGIFSLCAGQAVAVTAATPAAAVAGEILLLLLFLRLSGAGAGKAGHLLLLAAMAGGLILLFTVTRGLVIPLVILAVVGLLALLYFALADYRLKQRYGLGGTDEAVQ
jgi:hypothetical protein